ncbi:hypothetical protein NEF87_000621 [Candidatus Lokiarchaeum ossiferum]|uniref:GIY-YIG domain-containing protein n=1 Tax=Candidatus Lokiarchaeum ossiferum TaxID=2951803 RepID=A0ABY6HLE7_9ARCH|nr:hypothetical protein NEF87_000621 [Candidatus Lokiarchaeum sp. B-35]
MEAKKITSGTYILWIDLAQLSHIKIGKLGNIKFQQGNYVYIGSAMNSQLKNRVLRHLKPSTMKKNHWHIDFFLASNFTQIKKITLIPSHQKEECSVSQQMRQKMDYEVTNFGSSDCKCSSHLYFMGDHLEF